MEVFAYYCEACGAPLEKAEVGFICPFCGTHYEEDPEAIAALRLQDVLAADKLEKLSNAKAVLYKAIHAPNPSNAQIELAVHGVLSLNPNDLYANFFHAAIDNDASSVNQFLLENQVSLPLAEEITFWMMKSLEGRNVIAFKTFVERHFIGKRQLELLTQIEEEAYKLDNGVYSTNIPRDVFLAYSSEDQNEVSRLTDLLEGNGFSVFVAYRNLRHGKGAAEHYLEAICDAIAHCKTLVFLSSKSSRQMSCDALKIELPYIADNFPHMGRVEFLLEEYDPKTPTSVKIQLKRVFEGLEWVKDEQDLITRLLDLTHIKLIACPNCGHVNNEKAKYCLQCGRPLDKEELARAIVKEQEQKEKEEALIKEAERIKKLAIEQNAANASSLLERAKILLEDGEFSRADELLEQVLNIDPKNADAYFYKFLAEKHLHSEEEAKKSSEPYLLKGNLKRAYDYAGEDGKNRINNINQAILAGKKDSEKLEKYNIALVALKDGDYAKAKNLFIALRGFKDSYLQSQRCDEIPYRKASELKRTGRYEEAIEIYETLGSYFDCQKQIEDCKVRILERNYKNGVQQKTNKEYEKAIESFAAAKGFMDAPKLLEECKAAKTEAIYEGSLFPLGYEFPRDLKDIEAALARLEKIPDYKDAKGIADKYRSDLEAYKKKKAKRARKRHIIEGIVSIPLTGAIVGALCLTLFVLIPSSKEKNARALLEAGNYEEALAILEANGNYGETAKFSSLAKAGKAFQGNDYETAIDCIYSQGGEVQVTYDANGGTVAKSSETIKKAKLIDNTPKKDGYSFAGWKIMTFKINIDAFSAAVTLKAEYSNAIYPISYELNGGSASSLPESYTYLTALNLPNATRTGYEFLGWSASDDSTPKKDYSIPSGEMGPKSFTASWKANTYKITLDPAGGSVSESSLQVAYDAPFVLPIPTKTDYGFKGWFDERGTQIQSGTYTTPNDLFLIAQWAYGEYTISYDLGGGINAVSNPSVYSKLGEEIVLQDPSREGYTFLGWTGADITTPTKGAKIPAGSTGDLNFKANWQANTYTINLDPKGGSLPQTQLAATFNAPYELPTPIYEGYEFEGWTDASGQPYPSQGTFIWAGDVIFYAKYSSSQYSIHYDLDGGTNDPNNPGGFNIDTETFVLSAPTKTGYTFLGWKKGNDDPVLEFTVEKGSTGGISLKAIWQANSYRVTLDPKGGILAKTTYDFAYGSSYLIESVPEKQGYDFLHYEDESGNELPLSGTWAIAEDVILIAKYTPKGDTSYLVKYVTEGLDGQYSLQSQETLKGFSDSTIDVPAKEIAGFTPESATKKLTIAADGSSVIEFRYSRNSYTLSFETYGNGTIPFQKLKYEEPFPNVANPSATGMTFEGWFADENCTQTFATMPAQNATAYASFDTTAFEYEKSNGKVSIKRYKGSSDKVVIPERIKGCPVTSIGEGAFQGLNIISITLPALLQQIADTAFADCVALGEVINLSQLPIAYGISDYGHVSEYAKRIIVDPADSAIEVVNGCVIAGSTHLIRYIGNGGAVTVPDGITTICAYAFRYVYSITDLILPSSLRTIEGSAFYFCHLDSLTFYASNLSFNDGSFQDYSTAENVYVKGTLAEWLDSKIYGGLFKKNVHLMFGENGEESRVLDIPEGTTSLATRKFYGCNRLIAVTLPETLKSIPARAFANCSQLSYLCVKGATSVGYDAFANCSSLYTIVNLASLSLTKGSTDNGYIAYCAKAIYTEDHDYDGAGVNEDFVIDGGILLRYYGNDKNVTIPNEATAIGPHAFEGSSLEKITIPSSVTLIDEYAFDNCLSLKQVTVQGNGLSRIAGHAFGGCSNLISFDCLSSSLTSIDAYAFFVCPRLSSFIIPSGVTSIGNVAFNGCSILQVVNLSPYITVTIGSDSNGQIALHAAVVLNDVEASKIKKTEDFLIYDSTVLLAYLGDGGEVIVPEGITELGNSLFRERNDITSISLPSTLTKVGTFAFYNCGQLSSIEFPAGITKIGQGVLEFCNSLKTVVFRASSLSLDSNSMSCSYNIVSLTIPADTKNGGWEFGDVEIYVHGTLTEWLSRGSSSYGLTSTGKVHLLFGENETPIDTVSIPGSVTSIPKYAFANCVDLVSITIPSSVTSIGKAAFRNCLKLTALSIPNSVITMEEGVLKGCEKLASLKWPSTISSIPAYTFCDCSSLPSFTIAGTVTSIGDYAFSGCKSFTSITVPSTVTSVGASAFSNCSKLVSVSLPTGLTSIGNYVFANDIALTNIVWPTSSQKISNGAFSGCLGLRNIVIPNGIKTIGDSAFAQCTSLCRIVLPSSLTKIESSAFSFCYRLWEIVNLSSINLADSYDYDVGNIKAYVKNILTSSSTTNLTFSNGLVVYGGSTLLYCYSNNETISLPSSIEIIGDYAFYGNTVAKRVLMGNVVSIGNHAFEGCTALESISLPSSLEAIGSHAFSGCVSLQTISLPSGIVLIKERSFYNCFSLTEVKVGGAIASIGNEAFYRCGLLASAPIAEETSSIGNDCFYGCYSLRKVTIPESVISMGSKAFAYCTSASFAIQTSEKPAAWKEDWNPSNRPVVWNATF